MRLWHALVMRLRSLLLRRRSEGDLDEELQLHLEREAARLEAGGVPQEEARRLALRAFGGVQQIKDACRDARGSASLDAAVRELRHGGRRLVRDRGFTAAAVLILGLGIGANTAIFSVVNAALLRDQRYADPDRLVEIYQNDREGRPGVSSYAAFQDIAGYTGPFAASTAVSVPYPVDYRDEGAIRTAVAEYTTATYLSVLGIRPFLGRWFEASEDVRGASVVAVVGHRTWIRRFGADPSIVGRTIRIEGLPATIVGVGPAGHNGTFNLGVVTDFWLPVSSGLQHGFPPRALERRPVEAFFFVKARLRDGVTVAQAQSAMDTLGVRLAEEYPDEDPGGGITVLAASDVRIHPQLDALVTALASILIVVVGLVLAIACSNLATLLIVRGAARAREISVRLALGATRQQIVGHLLTESLLLSLAGGTAGCVVAWWGLRSLSGLELPIAVDFSIDYRVLAFAVVLSLVTGATFGLAPALEASKVDLVASLRDESGPRSPDRRWFTLKNALLVFQVAVSFGLLSTTSVFLQMTLAARALRVGYAVEGVAMLQTDVRYAGYSATDAAEVYDALRRRVAAIPGVQSLTLTGGEPMQTTGLPLVVEGSADGRAIVVAASIWAAPGYFETLRIPIVAGRALEEGDRAGTARVAVISESMARRHFGTVNAVGRRFRIDQDANWIEVVGVARDTGTADLGGDLVDPTPYLFYRASAQWSRPLTTIVARTSLNAPTLVGAMQRELRAIDPALPVIEAKTMAQYLEDSLAAPKAVAAGLGVLGIFGVCLASIGLYAVVAFAVTRRSREIGIRMALGARREQVVWTVARQVAAVVGVGTAAGLTVSALGILALRAASAPAPNIALYRPTLDPVALLSITAVMAVVAMLAAFVPARRAARMDPLSALRHD